MFAWYSLTGSLATAFGSLLCGLIVQGLHDYGGFSNKESYRIVLWVYAGVAAVLAALFLRLSPAAEAGRPLAPPSGRRLAERVAHHAAAPRLAWPHRSRNVVLGLAGLFALDAFAGGFVIQSAVVEWFRIRFGADAACWPVFWAANVLAGFSALAAAAVARRVGLLRTMVFTHVPSNVLLVLVPFMPNLPLAVTMLLSAFSISQMDVPARQSYTAAVVSPDERLGRRRRHRRGPHRRRGPVAVPRRPAAGAGLVSWGWPFILSGGLKLVYDGLVYWLFLASVPPEEQAARPGK